MTFETLNSVYQVTVQKDGKFSVVKVKELAESGFNAVGVPRVSSFINIGIGTPAHFEGWRTSRVTNILETL